MADWIAWTGWVLFASACVGWWSQSQTTATWRSVYYASNKTERSWRRMFFETRAELFALSRDRERELGHDALADWCESRRAHWEELAKNVH